jgi:hypothetical protein
MKPLDVSTLDSAVNEEEKMAQELKSTKDFEL